MLIILGSPWHAILAKSYIAKYKINDCKFIIEKANDRAFDEIVSILDIKKEDVILTIELESFRILPINKVKETLHYIRHIKTTVRKAGFCEQKTVLVFAEQNMFFKIFYDTFGETKIYIKIEDGILDYLPMLKFSSKLKQILAFTLIGGNYKYYTYRDFFSVFKQVLMLKKPSSVKEDCYISLLVLQKNIQQTLNKKYDIKVLDNIVRTPQTILFLCQSLSEDNFVDMESEIAIYEEYIKGKVLEGFFVLIKMHPRNSLEKLEAVKQIISKYPDNTSLFEVQSMPAEALLSGGHFHSIVGMYSNTIIYSKSFFNVEGVSLLSDNLVSKVGVKHRKRIAYIAKELQNIYY